MTLSSTLREFFYGWVAVNEFCSSSSTPDTIVFSIYPCYDNLNFTPCQQPGELGTRNSGDSFSDLVP